MRSHLSQLKEDGLCGISIYTPAQSCWVPAVAWHSVMHGVNSTVVRFVGWDHDVINETSVRHIKGDLVHNFVLVGFEKGRPSCDRCRCLLRL